MNISVAKLRAAVSATFEQSIDDQEELESLVDSLIDALMDDEEPEEEDE